MKDPCIRQCFMNGRHWKLFFMLTMQYCMDLTPDLRANVDYIFILRENVIQNREKLYKSFLEVKDLLKNKNEEHHYEIIKSEIKSY